jgi:transcriptional regulator with XRE-family HTH domain
MIVGERLKAVRERLGLTQRQLAHDIGTGHAMIFRYEHGMSDPTSSTLKALSARLNVSIDYLVGISDEPETRASQLGLNREEQQVIAALRREGWAGILRLGADKLEAITTPTEPDQ